MDNTTLDLTLKLKPIQGNTNNADTVTTEADGGDAWLKNDDKNILQNFSSDGSDALNSVIEKLSTKDDPLRRTYHVSEIIIKEGQNSYNLHAPQGIINLERGDILVTPIGAFQVDIEKKQIVVNPDPKVDSTYAMASAVDDIWSQPTAVQAAAPALNSGLNPELNSGQTNPFGINPMTQNQSLDPLTFLGGEQQHAIAMQSLPGVIPQASGLGALPYDPIASMASPMPVMPAQMHAQDALNIQSDSHYQPSVSAHTTLQNHPQFSQEQTQGQNSNQGDILRDLNITEQNSAIANTQFADQIGAQASLQAAMPGQSQGVLTEQSPIDMLDEYLGDEPLANYGMNYGSHCEPVSVPMLRNTIPQGTSLLGTIKEFKKKILG